MGSSNFFTVVANNFDVLAGPLVALVYPLHASIKAIENGSRADDQQWLTYWVLYSLITLFELTCAKILESFPIWGYAKLCLTCWLVLPQFNGASYLYKNFIRPFYFNPYQTTTIWYLPKKKNGFRQQDDILTAAERSKKKDGFRQQEDILTAAERCKKKDVFRQPDDILTAAERYMEENGTEAFQRIISKTDRGAKSKRNHYMGNFDEYDRYSYY